METVLPRSVTTRCAESARHCTAGWIALAQFAPKTRPLTNNHVFIASKPIERIFEEIDQKSNGAITHADFQTWLGKYRPTVSIHQKRALVLPPDARVLVFLVAYLSVGWVRLVPYFNTAVGPIPMSQVLISE